MSELQAEVVEQVVSDTTQTEPQENDNPQGSESAPEKVTFSEAQQKLVDDIAAKKTFKIREAERETDKLRQELAAAQAKIPKEVRPNIPAMPDEYAEDRDAQIAQRDEAIRQSAVFDNNQANQLRQQEADSLKVAQDRQTEINQVFADYDTQATKLGVDAQELLAAGTAVGQYGLSNEVVLHIAKDDKGPLITTYLHKNPAALETIRQLDSLSAAAYIETQIKPQAAALGNKQPTAPDPIETLNGSGVAPRERGPKGATFE
jgi:hypothetical protein